MSMTQREIYNEGRNDWVLNQNFQTEMEYGHTQADAMVRPSQSVVYADSAIPRIPSCLEDVWQFPEADPMIRMPNKINKRD
jgi:hypothetical protein